MTTAVNVSVAVNDWNVSLVANELMSEINTDGNVQAYFDLHINPADMNRLFVWDLDGNPNAAAFASDASGNFLKYCQQQVYLPTSTDLSRNVVSPSLATHFLLSKQFLTLSAGMQSDLSGNTAGSLLKCNMIEEKILAVSNDIFNSTSGFVLFKDETRTYLAQDYYILGKNALTHIVTNKFTTTVATNIVEQVVSQRGGAVETSTFSLFTSGDELTFNVIAVSSPTQYDIVQRADVNKNLTSRMYKFRIVADSSTTLCNLTAPIASNNYLGTPLSYSGTYIMGGSGNEATYKIIYNYENTTTINATYKDSSVTGTTYSATGTAMADGSYKF